MAELEPEPKEIVEPKVPEWITKGIVTIKSDPPVEREFHPTCGSDESEGDDGWEYNFHY
jgi:hypothetical protein